VSKKDKDMTPETLTADLSVDLENSALLRLLALAMDKVQRRRHRPKKAGRLHRV
jgi:hypothetical protein